MRRVLALAVLLACVGCATNNEASVSKTHDLVYQPNNEFFSTANMGGDPLPAPAQGK